MVLSMKKNNKREKIHKDEEAMACFRTYKCFYINRNLDVS